VTTKRFALVGFAALALTTVGGAIAQAQNEPVAKPAAAPPPKPAAPVAAVAPADSAVALCNNGTWVYVPGTSADCVQRGGLKVAMPPKPVSPAVVAAAAARAEALKSAAASKVVTAPPANATMQCKDGTYLFGPPSDARCANNGGVAATFAHPAPAPAPAPVRPPSR
jgi:outer membrane lipoprotein-sorting protein